MTAEIAILNRAAIAIAADSAVTLVADRKVYKTANKIFPLSHDPPIVIMFYGTGSLGSIPWETIVQEYKRKYPTVLLSTIAEHATHFIEFLDEMVHHISDRAQTVYVRAELLTELEGLSQFAQVELANQVRTRPNQEGKVLDYWLSNVQWHISERSRRLRDIGTVARLTHRVAQQQLERAVREWELFDATVRNWNDLCDLWLRGRADR